jgi:hypothetical protein
LIRFSDTMAALADPLRGTGLLPLAFTASGWPSPLDANPTEIRV